MAGEKENYLALDFGAESGRAMLGSLTEERLELQEVHRFPNGPCFVGERWHWNTLYLLGELKKGLTLAHRAADGNLASLGVDTWGVDFGLIDASGELLANPVHYRDPRTNGIFERAFKIVPRKNIFEQTGIQFLQFNTLFQLFALRGSGSPLLAAADKLLMMPDLFNFWLTGERTQEYTIATTTQCYDARRGEWAWPLIEAFGIPTRLFGPVTRPGRVMGNVGKAIMEELNLAGEIAVALPATHDTGSAVAAVPAQGKNWAYISSGTWALLGAETREPIINDRALEYNFTNEGGAFGTNRLLTNVMGLWLLQQSRRAWSREGRELSYEEILQAAEQATPFAALVDPDHPSFFNPPNMLAVLADYCRRTAQSPPESVAATARCIIESLAMKYRLKIEQLEDLLGRKIEIVHIVGGGSKNRFLCQATADACGKVVLAGPGEATAMGNVLVQAVAGGRLNGMDDLRAVARRSSAIEEFHPHNSERWEEPYRKFAMLVGKL